MGIRIGIVGAGTTVAIADRHVEGFLAQAGRCTVTAVCSRTLEGCRRLCIRHGLDGVRMTTRLEELLDVVDAVDAVCWTSGLLPSDFMASRRLFTRFLARRLIPRSLASTSVTARTRAPGSSPRRRRKVSM